MDNKKSKYMKIVNLLYLNVSLILNHLNYTYELKIHTNEFYNKYLNILNEINSKISKFELYCDKKRINKNFIENLIKDISETTKRVLMKIGCSSYSKLIDFFYPNDKNYLNDNQHCLIENYFIPLSCSFIQNNDNPNKIKIINLMEYSEGKSLYEKIEGATIIYNTLCIHGFFKKDTLNICKSPEKLRLLNNELIDVPQDFKEKYIKHLSLRDFIIMNHNEICDMLKRDYKELGEYKNKALSALIKEFTKSPIEKQRKIIGLFLISEMETQFTAHIIYDLISDQVFFADTQQHLSEIIYNSFNWEIQKLFKISNNKFEASKKNIQNLSISDIPYETRVLSLNVSDFIKGKAMEKIKEVNGSKENSTKAQQWLDGFFKIPFGVYNKEPIIDFFKSYQEKFEQYMNILTITIGEHDIEEMNTINKLLYNEIIKIVDEYHSILFKSENSYTEFFKLYLNIRENIRKIIINNENHPIYIKIADRLIYNNDKKTISELILQSLNEIKENNDQNKSLKILENILNQNDENMSDDEDEIEDIPNINYIFTKFIINSIYELNIYNDEWDEFRNKKMKYMEDVDVILDKCVYGQNDAKKQMKRIIGQWMNGVSKGQCFGLCGPPGVGKTTICKNGLAKCLFDDNGNSRPFAFLPIGGATNGSFLEGHHYTYLGSTWGKIVDILMETKCMNPIIYIDELDKISKTEQGKEIASLLTHITDQSQNKEFYDKYFNSIPIDLSQILFIFSYNDRDNIDSILRDRIQEINIKPLTRNEKLIITKNYLCPDIFNNVGYSPDEIIISKDALSILIEEYTYEAGVRKLNEILYDVVRDINLNKITGKFTECPINIDKEYIKKFMEDRGKINKKVINPISRIGLVNGLYATSAGLGGLTVIQVMKTLSDKKVAIERVTGSLGDVMKDSLNLALTMAWNIIPDERKKIIMKSESENYGLHIHCPDLSTTKDGPSASLAFCLGFVSRLCDIPVKNTVALTGEMDLLGNSMAIGGLESKLMGAINAGVKTVLIPRENEEDLDIIIRKDNEEVKVLQKKTSLKNIDYSCIFDNINDENNEEENKNKKIFRNKLIVYIVDNIYDVLKYALEDNNIIFNTMF